MNIRNLAWVGIMAVSLSANAQKDELKALKKLYAIEQMSNKDVAEYKAALAKAEPLATDPGDKVYVDFYKGMLPLLEVMTKENVANPAQAQTAAVKAFSPEKIEFLAQALNATLEYEKTNKKVYTDDIKETIQSFSPQLINYAVALQQAGKNKEGAKVLYAIYQLDKTNPDTLYYAANFAVNGQDYDSALKYYRELVAQNYTGEKTLYMAKSKVSDNYETFPDKASRDTAVKIGTHSLPKEEKESSKSPEIYGNIVKILLSQKKKDEAKAILKEGLQKNPGDAGLKALESDMVLDTANYADYLKVADQTNVDNVYNLGVLALQENKLAEAETHLKKVIQMDPNYTNAYVNLAAIKLKGDAALVEQMNKLGTSAAETKKYDVLKAKRQELFRSTLPDLEKAYALDPKNEDVVTNLLSVYGYLEMTEKRNALKAATGR